MELENIILSEVSQSQKEHTWYALADKWMLAQNIRIPKMQLTHRPYEAQEVIPKCGYFESYWKVDQNTHGSQPTNRMSIGSPVAQLEKGAKELKRFVTPKKEQ